MEVEQGNHSSAQILHSSIHRAYHFVHSHLLKLLLLMYVAAVISPRLGVAIKDTQIGKLAWGGTNFTTISLPTFMLTFLLLNAGISVRLEELKKVLKYPLPLVIGLCSNLVIPLLFTLCFAAFGRLFWHSPDEIQNVLVGLAFIASMPIAGSSTTWVQNCNGNPALILGLVVSSTILSPLLTPLVFHTIGHVTTGDYSEDLHEIASQGVASFLTISVVIPSVLGIAIRFFLGESKWKSIAIYFKIVSLCVLLVLNYTNASVSLPVAIKQWDLDFLAMVGLSTTLLCIVNFTTGWIVPNLFRLKDSEKISLAYGLGMSNNGTGLVLASASMADHPLIMIPIIFYNLGQQVVAGIFSSKASQIAPSLDVNRS